MTNCRNCEKLITAEMQFCPYCSQKNTDGKIRVRSFLAVFVNQVFNIESKLFKTLRDLFIPGKLTIEYFKGKHKTYFHPLRLFIVLAVIYIALVGFSQHNFLQINDDGKSISSPSFHKKVYYFILLQQLDSLNNVNYQTKKYNTNTYTHIQQLICDTLEKYEKISRSDSMFWDVEAIDLIELNAQEIIDKYNIEGFWDVLLFKQGLKVSKGGDSGINSFILNNALWAILLMMPFLAFILMLFYNKKYYYVEHLVFSFHAHSFIFFLFIVLSLPYYLLNFVGISNKIIEVIVIIIILIVPVYILFALKNVYDQKWWITVLKFLGISFNYAILSLVFFILIVTFGFVFF